MQHAHAHGGPTDAAPTDAFRHVALFYSDSESFLAGTMPFVREAAEAGAPVLVALGEANRTLLRSELGPRAEHVLFAEMETIGRNPGRIIPLWRQFVDKHHATPSPPRGIGEPVWPGRSPAALDECRRHESLLNLAFGDGPGWELLCPYDAANLDHDVLETAHRTHPFVTGSPGSSASAVYEPAMAADVFYGALPEPVGAPDELCFTRDQLRDVRQFVSERARAAGVDDRRAADLTLAASELAANSVRHGEGGGAVRVWRDPEGLVCEVRDGGQIHDLLAGRIRPGGEETGGRGLWLVNHLCDLVQIRSSAGGTVVRLHLALAD